MKVSAFPPIVAIALGLKVFAGYAALGNHALGLVPEDSPPPGWTAYTDPLGFSLRVPQGWKVTADRRSGRVSVERAKGEQVIIWPCWIPGALDSRAAAPVLQKLLASAGPSMGGIGEWGRPQSVRSNAVRMLGRSDGRAAVALFSWVTSPKGSAGYLYVTFAPAATYRQDQETFARILESFRVVGPSSSQPQEPSLTYVKWRDPKENAFSLEVPGRWQMTGGLFRFAAVDTRAAWEAASPDGQIRISSGDADIPTFTIPSQMLSMAGFHEGTWYSPGYGVNLFVRRYVAGSAFVQEYVTSKIARACSGLRLADTRDRPDVASAVNAVYRQYAAMGFNAQLTAGETAFTCQRNGRGMEGYYFAGTQRVQGAAAPGGLWHVEYLFGYMAAGGKAQLAQSALNHMLASLQVNPQWLAMQQGITANTSQIVSRTQEEISKTITSSYWTRQAVMDEVSRRRSNAILGVVDVVDPETGRQIKVENSSNYYWINPQGMIVGTQTDTRPDLDFRGLLPLP